MTSLEASKHATGISMNGLRKIEQPGRLNIQADPRVKTFEFEIDQRLAFMARAGLRHDLVVSGVMEIGEAFDGLIDQFEAIMGYFTCANCGAAPCANPSFCAAAKTDKQRGPR